MATSKHVWSSIVVQVAWVVLLACETSAKTAGPTSPESGGVGDSNLERGASEGGALDAGDTKPSSDRSAPDEKKLEDTGAKDAREDDAGRDDPQRDAGPQAAAPASLASLSIGETEPLAAVAGYYGPSHEREQFYSGDLAWAIPDHDRMWILFGDSWVNPLVRTIDVASNQDADDAIGIISLRDYPDGATVERFIRSHPAPDRAFAWQAMPPAISLVLNPSSGVATPMRQLRDATTPMTSGAGLTPLAAFANQRDGDSAALFGLFFRNAPVECEQEACPGGLRCDVDLGVCIKRGQKRTNLSVPCVLGSPSTADCEQCEPVPGRGLCVDTRSSTYRADVARGRTTSVAVTHEVGNLIRGSDHEFATQAWQSHRFYNMTARTVREFDPERAYGAGNDYRPAAGSDGREGVFLWGRPSFGGVHKAGRDAQLYLAYSPMPSYAANGHFDWKPRYFAGEDASGRPRFVDAEIDSLPLDLDAAESGSQPAEPIDIVGHMTVAYLPSFERWIMLYGGDLQTLFAGLIFGDDLPLIDRATAGPIYVRYASNPWGPWTPPEIFARPGDPAAPSGLYGKGGILRSVNCREAGCVTPEITLTAENGWLYAPHIIEPWIQPREEGRAIDLYWHVSTWNPYQVILMKTTLTR